MSQNGGGRRPPGDYSVGYGRPPRASQFKPGQSGNPYGRRPKLKDGAASEQSGVKSASGGSELDRVIQDELNRYVDAQENGQQVRLTVIQAAVRSMGLAAMKGRTHAQRAIVQLANDANEKQLDRRAYARHLVHNYRRSYPQAVKEFERIYPGKLCYLAHPDDVFYNEELGILDFKGPFTEAGWHIMNLEEFLCKQILIAVQDLIDFFPADSTILSFEVRDFATGLYNAAEKIRRQLPERLHRDLNERKPKNWTPDPERTGVDLIYYGVLSPLPPGLLRMLEADPTAYDYFHMSMSRLDFTWKGRGVNRTSHCISAFGEKLTPSQQSHALGAISGTIKPAALIRRLMELGSKMLLPGHVLCNAKSAAGRIYCGQDVTMALSDFRESLSVG